MFGHVKRVPPVDDARHPEGQGSSLLLRPDPHGGSRMLASVSGGHEPSDPGVMGLGGSAIVLAHGSFLLSDFRRSQSSNGCSKTPVAIMLHHAFSSWSEDRPCGCSLPCANVRNILAGRYVNVIKHRAIRMERTSMCDPRACRDWPTSDSTVESIVGLVSARTAPMIAGSEEGR